MTEANEAMDINSSKLNVTFKPLVNILLRYPYQREHELFTFFVNSIWPVLMFAGILSNAMNMVVFIKVGIKDSVSTLLLTLSISDFIFLSVFSPTIVRASFSRFGTYQVPALSDIHYLFFWPAFTFYDYSGYISVFLGVTRCACVAMPLQFKSVFTVKRTAVAILILFCSDVLLHLPMLTVFRLGWVRDPLTNRSSLSLVRDSATVRASKQNINDILNKNTIQWAAFIIMIASVALLSFKLFESSKVRSSATRISSPNDTSDKSTQPKQTNSHKLSPKDAKVVQSVILVCSIFIIAQLPSLIYTAIRATWSEFNGRGRYRFLASICINVSWTFYLINASFNIIVYYNYNSKFKSVFRSLLHLK